MVDLQDAANLAVVVGLVISAIGNLYSYLYGPWAKRREERRQILSKVVTEIESAKVAAKEPRMSAYMGRLETWKVDERRLPQKIRREIAPFAELSESYWDSYILASKLVELAIYKSVAARTDLAPVLPRSTSGGEVRWVVDVDGNKHSKNNIEDSLIAVLTEPLIRGDHVRWSWLKDHQENFAALLLLVTDESSVNRLLEDIEGKLHFEGELVERPRQIKAAIRDYRFRNLRVAG